MIVRSKFPTVASSLGLMCAMLMLGSNPAQAQNLTVLHYFSNVDGAGPHTGLTMDRTGNLYGTTTRGGANDNGTVFKLSRAGTGWVLATLYTFIGGPGGDIPSSGVVFGPNGTLYGMTTAGGSSSKGV